jgi:hypothetical protein
VKRLFKKILGPARSEQVASSVRTFKHSTPVETAVLHREVDALRVALAEQLAARQAERLQDRRDAASYVDDLADRLAALDAKIDALAEHLRMSLADISPRVADLEAGAGAAASVDQVASS